MHYKKIVAIMALAATGVAALPAPAPEANTGMTEAGSPLGLTERNLARLTKKSPKAKGKSHKSKSSKSSRSSYQGATYYRRIRSESPTGKALKRSIWKYYTVRSTTPVSGAYDTGSYKSGGSKKSKAKSHSSGKSMASKSGKYIRRSLSARNAEPEPKAWAQPDLDSRSKASKKSKASSKHSKASSKKSHASSKSGKSASYPRGLVARAAAAEPKAWAQPELDSRSKASKKSHASSKSGKSASYAYYPRGLVARNAAAEPEAWAQPELDSRSNASKKSKASSKKSKASSKKSHASHKSGKSGTSTSSASWRRGLVARSAKADLTTEDLIERWVARNARPEAMAGSADYGHAIGNDMKA